MLRRLLVLLGLGLALLAVPATAFAGEPPNPNDPCSKAGKDSCGTTGVGSYKTYKYGIRWFGDYRGAIPDYSGPSFCIDLRYWYPSKAFNYQELSAAGLKNRDGKTVSQSDLRRMSYALWRYGRSGTVSQQAAVMLYVHGLMDDGAPGEIAPSAVGYGAQYDKISTEAKRLAGPYKLTASLPKRATVGDPTKLTVKLTAASGAGVPGIALDASLPGTKGLKTGSDGTASVTFTPSDADDLDVTVKAADLPSTLPKLFVPTKGAASGSGQRLVVPDSEPAEARTSTDVSLAQVAVTTKATPGVILVGERAQDEVTTTGVPKGYKASVQVKLFGPARTPDAITCTGDAALTSTYTASSGKSMSPALTPPAPGYYGYQLVVADTDGVKGVTTPCAEPSERIKVETQPRVQTQVSTTILEPGGPLSDTLVVSGLAGETVPVSAKLYGPFAAADKLNCDGPPVYTGTVNAPGDGTYQTEATKLTTPGYYTYRESIDATDLVRTFLAPCGEGPETAIVRGHPTIRTQISAAETSPGSQISDTAVISGLGALTADIQVDLYGPFDSPEAIRCDVAPFATQTVPGVSDGTIQTPPVTLTAAGYYSYREQILPSAAYDGVQTACAEGPETTIAKAAPVVTTVVTSAQVRPGGTVADKIKVTGAGATPLKIAVDFFGPFRSRAAISCSGDPRATKFVDAPGDGQLTSPEFDVPKAGFYVFRERIASAPFVKGVTTPCADEAETSFGVPLILTGRGDDHKVVFASTPLATKGTEPAKITAARLGVSAKIFSIDVDPDAGVLDIPTDISKVGWWRDGAALGDKTGTVLLAGHVDSAARGAGAFYGIKNAKVGDRVTVADAQGKARSYRVTGKKTILKAQIPTSIFTRTGPPKLVLVTCGGPFDAAEGHYRDNVIVTAVPV